MLVVIICNCQVALQENPKVRADLIRAVFRACDTNSDDWLGESEFRHIAWVLVYCDPSQRNCSIRLVLYFLNVTNSQTFFLEQTI